MIRLIILVTLLSLVLAYLALPRIVLFKINKIRSIFDKFKIRRLAMGESFAPYACPIANSITVFNKPMTQVCGNYTILHLHTVTPTMTQIHQLERIVRLTDEDCVETIQFDNPLTWRIFILLFDRGLYPTFRLKR